MSHWRRRPRRTRVGTDAEASKSGVVEREHAPLYTGQVPASTLVAEMKMNLDKTQVARRHLGTALALFLDDLDPVSVHTLACAGCEVAEHLTRKAGAEPFSTHVLATFPSLDIQKIRRLQNQYWNAFKHATTRDGLERDDQELLDRFDDDTNNHTLFIGWHDYMLATGTLPPEAQAFQMWYFALYPDKLNPDVDSTPYERVFPNLKEKSAPERKKMLRDWIASARNDLNLMTDPRTDARPLILPAE
ncbi:MAG TPA: hypothetical protein VM822_04165 [Pseudolabrys sp.]|nr:hypothetical protein [Pseudolabrys sp.]